MDLGDLKVVEAQKMQAKLIRMRSNLIDSGMSPKNSLVIGYNKAIKEIDGEISRLSK